MKKTMKKSMLVTTVLMVLLLIVALSTATFAWYTAQSSVSVTTTEVTSATSNAASLAIDKLASTTSTNSTVTITMGEGAIMPMVPTAEPVVADTGVDATKYSAFIASFTQAAIDNANKFLTAGTSATPATISGVQKDSTDTASGTSFFVINTNKDKEKSDLGAKVTIATNGYSEANVTSANFDTVKANLFTKSGTEYTALAGDATFDADTAYFVANEDIAKVLRVAMFVDGDYVATWGNTADTYYGTIASGANSATSLSTYSAINNRVTIKDTLDALDAVEIELVAWFDGVGLNSGLAGASALFTVVFD